MTSSLFSPLPSYGYYGNQHSQSFHFSKPRYQLYPYSQQDIPANHYQNHHQDYVTNAQVNHYHHYHPVHSHQHPHTSVEIVPSRSYEIKQTEHGYKTVVDGEDTQQGYNDLQSQVHNEEETVPVIVLRIPGPQKYASHLQALLQQYLEVRAAQYIQMLQEHEARGHNVGYQSLQYNVAPADDSYHTIQYQSNHADQQQYAAPVAHQEYSAPQHAGYDYQPQQPEHEHTQQQEEPEELSHSVAVAPESDSHSQLVYQTDDVPETQYQQEDFHPSQVDHGHHQEESHVPQQPSVVYGPSSQHEEESHYDHGPLLTTENFPSDKHTQVIFRTTTQQPYNYQSSHAPEVQVQTIRAPLVYHKLEQFYGNEPEYNAEHEYGAHSDIGSAVSEGNYVTITPRPSSPYNYHAHPPEDYEQDYSSAASSINVRSTKRQTQLTDERYKKFTNLMNRLKERMTSTKTTVKRSLSA